MKLNFWKSDSNHSVEPPADSVYVGENIYQRLSKIILLAGIGVLPLLFLPWTTGPLEMNKQIFLILFSGSALVLWLVGVVTSGYLQWRRSEFIKPIGAVAVATLLASTFSLSRFKSLFGISNSLADSLSVILALSVVALLIINNFDDKGKRVQTVLLGALALAFIYGVLQMIGVHLFRFSIAKTSVFNTIGSQNSLGVLAAISLPFLHKFKVNLPFVKNYLAHIVLALAVFILIVLNWWVLWTIAIVGMFSLVGLESLSSKGFKMSKSIVPLIIIVLGFFLMAVKFELPYFKSKLPAEIVPSYSLSWKISSAVLRDKLILGYGPENFSLAFDRYGSPALSNSVFSNAKFYDATSEFFNSLIHGGIVLAVAFLFFFGLIVWQIFKFYKNNSALTDDSSIGVVATMMTLMAAFFLYPFNITLMFVLYLVVSLVALSLWGDNKENLSIERSPFLSLVSSLSFIGGLVLVLISIYFGLLYYLADVKYAKALSESDNQKSATILAEAVKWNDNDDRYYRSLSQVALTLLSAEVTKQNDPQRAGRIQNYISSSVNFAQKATEVAPHESLNWTNLGSVYRKLLAVVDNVDKLAEDAFLKAAQLRPGDSSSYYQIGTMYLAKGDLLLQVARANPKNASQINALAIESYKKAEEALKKAVEISNNYGLAIYNLGIVYDREGKVTDAIKQLEKLAPANPRQPGLMFELGLLYYRAGRKDDALNQLQRALVLAPDYSNARWYSALIYEERSDINSAIAHLEKILSVEVNKDNQIVADKLKDLKSGKKAIPPVKVLDNQPL